MSMLSQYVCILCVWYLRGEKTVLDSLRLEFQMVVNSMWLLGLELGPLGSSQGSNC